MRRSGSEVPPRRTSDADRDHAVDLLRDAAGDGRLSPDSFVCRVDQALQARTDQSLAALLADLAPPRGAMVRLVAELKALGDRMWPSNSWPALPLPSRSSPVLVIGRHHDCDVVIHDDTASRVHAALMLFAGSWYITDRGSTNGTLVNGRRIWGTAMVRAGDLVSVGQSTFRLERPREPAWWG
jgi:hypothetical protein